MRTSSGKIREAKAVTLASLNTAKPSRGIAMSDAILGKRCSKCKRWKKVSQFGTESRRPDGLRCYCKKCGVEADRKAGWTKKYRKGKSYRATIRPRMLRARFGLTVEMYDAMLAAQDYKCAICRTTKPDNRYGKFFVDHCHKTKKVRGLLCHKCNRGLGSLGDTVEGIMRAVAYLENPPAKNILARGLARIGPAGLNVGAQGQACSEKPARV